MENPSTAASLLGTSVKGLKRSVEVCEHPGSCRAVHHSQGAEESGCSAGGWIKKEVETWYRFIQ